MKLFRSSNVAIVRQCQELFGFQLLYSLYITLYKRVDKFVGKYYASDNLLCKICSKFVLSCVLIDIYSWCHNLCYFAVYLYCFLIHYCFYHSLVNKDFKIADPPVDWRRRPGRSRQSWLRTVETDLRPLNLGLATAKRRTQDRAAWRRLVATATSTSTSSCTKKRRCCHQQQDAAR